MPLDTSKDNKRREGARYRRMSRLTRDALAGDLHRPPQNASIAASQPNRPTSQTTGITIIHFSPE